MPEYLIILLAISLALLVFIQLVKKSIPISARIIYCTVAVSFILGAAFPEAISKLAIGKVVGIYLGLIVFSAIVLSYIENRLSPKADAIPANAANLESEVPESASDFDPSLSAGEAGAINSSLPPAAADVTSDAANVASDAADIMPEIADVADDETSDAEIEQPVPGFMPDLPVTPAAQPVLPVDAASDPRLTSATKNVTLDSADVMSDAVDVAPDAADVAWDETYEQDCFEQADIPPEDNADVKMEAPAATTNDDIIADYISAGFEAKAEGDLNGAVHCFLKAFQQNQEQQVLTALAMEIATVYQELGQYFQAKIIIDSVLEQDDLIHDFSLKQKLKSQAIYLDTLIELLRTTKMSNAPYSKVPNLIKMKASIETSAKLTNLTKEAG